MQNVIEKDCKIQVSSATAKFSMDIQKSPWCEKSKDQGTMFPTEEGFFVIGKV